MARGELMLDGYYRVAQRKTKDAETRYELEFEEPALVTLAFAYEQRGRLAGGALAVRNFRPERLSVAG